MDLRQASIILKKINRLYDSIKLDEENIDVFEQDLMLSYIRQLYESFSDDPTTATFVPPTPKAPPAPKPKPRPKPVSTPKVSKPKPQPKPVEPVIEEIQEEVEIPVQAPTPPPPPPAPKPQPKPQPAPAPAPAPVAASSRPSKSTPRYDELFEIEEGKELSDKLSQLPISDLKKSMGLNEKILTINELFDGNNKAFDEVLSHLNSFASFNQARTYLSDQVVPKFKWNEKDRLKKAKVFMKLVRRRYK